jgi:hydrogenase maturation protease
MDTAPGTVRRFTPQEVRSTKVLVHQSLHEADLIRVIDMARQLDQAPEKIVLFGIQPERVELRQGLSETLTIRLEEYIALVLRELDA